MDQLGIAFPQICVKRECKSSKLDFVPSLWAVTVYNCLWVFWRKGVAPRPSMHGRAVLFNLCFKTCIGIRCGDLRLSQKWTGTGSSSCCKPAV